MVQQVEFSLPPYQRGIHLITREVKQNLPSLPDKGVLYVFIKHTSAGICINENSAVEVLHDLESFFNRIAPEDNYLYKHNEEGNDDMPAHIKSVLSGSSLVIPITKGEINLGTWQGIYLCEFRNNGGSRKLVLTVVS
ncbi:MAG: secondary thiamine-phosphate synthase enzyme YjbQ [Omnitrophica WOR_2 bacterium]|jgi:secondary thiamine-phosphate synthase enzyme